MHIRDAHPNDADQLLELMRDLARFEDYIDDFKVTKADILQQGFGPNALFKAFVAEHEGALVGMAVTYIIPWTYSLKPKLILKELFVSEKARGMRAGQGLMKAVTARAHEVGADHVAWTVMEGNRPAEAFYRSIGGEPDLKWNNWILPL